MRLIPAALAVATLAATPTTAAAQEPCAPPQITGFQAPGESIRTGRDERFGVIGSGIARVEVTKGPIVVRVRGDDVLLIGRFSRPGTQEIGIVAFSACGARSRPAALRLTVRRPCSRARDRSVYDVECDDERGSVRVLAGGLSARSTWLSAPCNDTGPPQPRVVPVARAASCAAPLEPYPVRGLLPIKPGRRATLLLAMPARRITARLGDRRRGPQVRLASARRLDATGRRWRITLPASLSAAHDRLFLGVVRANGADRYAAGVSVRAAS